MKGSGFMKKFISVIIVTAMLLATSLNSFAYGWLWGVGFLPSFPVTINEQKYNYNEYETFPLLVNGGVTYLPLTYNNAMILNLIPEYKENPLSIAYTRGNPDEVKQFFRKYLVKKVDAPSEVQNVYRDTNIFQTHHPIKERNDDVYNANAITKEYCEQLNIELTLDGKNLAELSEYPLLYFRNMYYIPLSWQFVTEVLGGTVSFDSENGLEVRVNNYFTTLNETEKITYTENVFVRGHSENATYYIKDDLTVCLTTGYHELVGATSQNLEIRKGENIIKPQGCFGVLQGDESFTLSPQFAVEGTKIKTFVSNEYRGQHPKPCIVDIETGEIYE